MPQWGWAIFVPYRLGLIWHFFKHADQYQAFQALSQEVGWDFFRTIRKIGEGTAIEE